MFLQFTFSVQRGRTCGSWFEKKKIKSQTEYRMDETKSTEEGGSILMDVFYEITRSPINLALVGVIALLVYKIWQSHSGSNKKATFVPEPELPRLRRDFTLEELRPYDGNGADGRVLVAVNGSVYDVTRGKRFYGPGEDEHTNC